MKNLLIVLSVIALVGAIPLTGCTSLVKGSGEMKTRDFTQSDFSEVKATDGIELKINYAASYNVTITADDNLLDYIQVSQKDETLSLGLKRADYVDAKVKAVITMPHIRKLSLSGGSTCNVSGFSSRAGVEFYLSGESAMAFAGMTVGDVTLEVADASKATGNITAGDVRLKASNGSTVQLGGAANDLTCEADGSSQLKLESFAARNGSITLSGESTAAVRLTGKMDVNLAKNSRLSYYDARYF